MPTTRKPRPEYLTLDEVAEMIAEAVAVERARNDQALAGVMLALGATAQSLEATGDVIIDMRQVLNRHTDFIDPMAAAFAASLGLDTASRLPDSAQN